MRRLLVLSVALPALAFAGCNRGEVVVLTDRTVEVSTDGFRLTPQRVRVKPGRITFRIANASRQPHTFQIARNGRVVLRVSSMLPGDSEAVRVRLRKGTYRMYCSIAHHVEIGEYGTVSVR